MHARTHTHARVHALTLAQCTHGRTLWAATHSGSVRTSLGVELCVAVPTWPFCTGGSSQSGAVIMQMYFHTGIADYILFKVPTVSCLRVRAVHTAALNRPQHLIGITAIHFRPFPCRRIGSLRLARSTSARASGCLPSHLRTRCCGCSGAL